MRRLRFVAALLLAVYAVAFLAAALHVHSNGVENSQCKLCQVSDASLVQTPENSFTPQFSESKACLPHSDVFVQKRLSLLREGRAPPIS